MQSSYKNKKIDNYSKSTKSIPIKSISVVILMQNSRNFCKLKIEKSAKIRTKFVNLPLGPMYRTRKGTPSLRVSGLCATLRWQFINSNVNIFHKKIDLTLLFKIIQSKTQFRLERKGEIVKCNNW